MDISYRLTIALALLNLPIQPLKRQKRCGADEPVAPAAYDPWLALVNGEVASISAENDTASRASLMDICRDLEKEASSALERLQRDMPREDDLVEMLRKLWETELWFARMLMRV